MTIGTTLNGPRGVLRTRTDGNGASPFRNIPLGRYSTSVETEALGAWQGDDLPTNGLRETYECVSWLVHWRQVEPLRRPLLACLVARRVEPESKGSVHRGGIREGLRHVVFEQDDVGSGAGSRMVSAAG
jgi:hypothetical protein